MTSFARVIRRCEPQGHVPLSQVHRHRQLLCFACKSPDGCGHAQENPRTQAAIEGKQWDGPCNERLVGQLLADLKGWGVELESLKPSDLFDVIRGRTLW